VPGLCDQAPALIVNNRAVCNIDDDSIDLLINGGGAGYPIGLKEQGIP